MLSTHIFVFCVINSEMSEIANLIVYCSVSCGVPRLENNTVMTDDRTLISERHCLHSFFKELEFVLLLQHGAERSLSGL